MDFPVDAGGFLLDTQEIWETPHWIMCKDSVHTDLARKPARGLRKRAGSSLARDSSTRLNDLGSTFQGTLQASQLLVLHSKESQDKHTPAVNIDACVQLCMYGREQVASKNKLRKRTCTYASNLMQKT